jgi:hypothetical protein
MDSINTTTIYQLERLTPGERLDWLGREIARLRETDPPAPWFRIASVLASVCEAADRGFDTDQEAGEIFAEASKAAGLSAQLLKRYVGVLRRTGSIADGAHLPIESLLSTMFNLQEVAVRLCERSPNEGIESLRDLASGQSHYGLATFRKLLANAPAASGSAERMRRQIQGAKALGRSVTARAITEARVSLWGAGATVRPRPRLLYFGGSGLEVIGGDGSVVAGIDLMVPHPGENRDVLAARAATSLSLAPFFREFYLAFAPNAGDDAPARAEALLEWLGYSWIGVIVVAPEGRATVRRKAGGSPTPDLSGRYEALKRKFPGGRASRQRNGESPMSDRED